jgi:thiol-disulfide isomerase/thioredoxin
MIIRTATMAIALAASLNMAPALAAPAPRVRIASVESLPQPLPLPYDSGADAERQVAAARNRARTSHKLLLIDLGGNWCPDCRILAGIMRLPEVAAFLARHYELVTVDVGRMDRNLAIPSRYGIARLEGVPALLVIDPATGRLINTGRIFALADARHMTPQALADWLAQWV